MGAEFQTMRVNSTDATKIKREFERAQEEDLYENGHSYSGGLGMAPGLELESLKTFETEDDADDYLVNRCQKWENAIGVPFKLGNKIVYLIGAWCSS